ncbi:MAG: dUTP diphosphatase [Clostridia bacterium]|nr:dUTP diphosphatase [Clostridia bacterium]
MSKKKIFYSYDNGMKSYPLTMGSRGSSGIDLCSQKSYRIERGASKLIETGLHVQIPEGYEIQIRPRSGLALKHGITVLNTPGTVDSDYRGEIGVILVNHSNKAFYITPGDRIAQAVVMKVETLDFDFEEVESLEKSERGEGGFGSTGVKSEAIFEKTELEEPVKEEKVPEKKEEVSEEESTEEAPKKKRGRKPKKIEENKEE